MGFLQSMFGSTSDMPGYQKTEIDPATKAAIDVQEAEANKTIDQLRDQKFQSVPKGEDLKAQVNEQQNFNKALGMATPMQLSEAMNRRAQRSYGAELEKMKRLTEPEAFSEKAKRIQMAGHQNRRRGQIEMEVAEGMRLADLNKKKARNSMISSMLGAVGTIGGAIAGTLIAPGAGTVAGASMGSKLGGMSGGGEE